MCNERVDNILVIRTARGAGARATMPGEKCGKVVSSGHPKVARRVQFVEEWNSDIRARRK
jgi:hypothetical protein